MCQKGIVIKVKDNYAIVLSEDNKFERIKIKNNLVVGQKIWFTSDDILLYQPKKVLNNRKLYAVAAIVLIILCSSILVFNNYLSRLNSAVALVTVDINPSVKIFVSQNNKVLKIESLNQEGKLLDLTDIIGIDIDEAIESIVSKARVAGFINDLDLQDDYVLITTIPIEDNKSTVQEVELLIKDKVIESDELQNVNVAIIQATTTQLSQAQNKNIPVGLYVINKGANKNNFTTVKEFFSSEEGVASFKKSGYIIEKDLEKDVKLIDRYFNELLAEKQNINIENIDKIFDKAKQAFIKAKKLSQVAKKEYQQALKSDNENSITFSKQLMEEAMMLASSLEEYKNEVEIAKQKLNNENDYTNKDDKHNEKEKQKENKEKQKEDIKEEKDINKKQNKNNQKPNKDSKNEKKNKNK